jgi:hypothetical protein
MMCLLNKGQSYTSRCKHVLCAVSLMYWNIIVSTLWFNMLLKQWEIKLGVNALLTYGSIMTQWYIGSVVSRPITKKRLTIFWQLWCPVHRCIFSSAQKKYAKYMNKILKG